MSGRLLYPAGFPVFCPECDAHLYDTAKAIRDDDTLMGDQLLPVHPQEGLALFMPAPPCNVCGGTAWARSFVSGENSPYQLEDDPEAEVRSAPDTASGSAILAAFVVAGYLAGWMIRDTTADTQTVLFTGIVLIATLWVCLMALPREGDR